MGFTFTFLSDVKADVIRRYDLLHHAGGTDGADTSRPAEFLLDSTRTVRWLNLTESYTVRARPEQVLEALDAMENVSSRRFSPRGPQRRLHDQLELVLVSQDNH